MSQEIREQQQKEEEELFIKGLEVTDEIKKFISNQARERGISEIEVVTGKKPKEEEENRQ